jgi:DNA repair exonuclease SbcCD ATPase subunit
MSDPTPGPESIPVRKAQAEAADAASPPSESRDLLDAELTAEIAAEVSAELDSEPYAFSTGAMVPVSPRQQAPGLWRRISTSRAGQRAKSFVESASNEPVLARLDEIREQLYTRHDEVETRLDRIESAGQPSAQRLDEIAAELRARMDRMGDPNQAVLALLDAQKVQIETAASQLVTLGERLERLETRVEEVWEVEEQLSQLAEMRERLESVAAQQQTSGEALASVRGATRIAVGLGVLIAAGLAALGWLLLAP